MPGTVTSAATELLLQRISSYDHAAICLHNRKLPAILLGKFIKVIGSLGLHHRRGEDLRLRLAAPV